MANRPNVGNAAGGAGAEAGGQSGATAGVARDAWQSRWGFILAAVGSAVGLGNMWRFSYLTAEKGGAAFVGLYIFFTFLIGMPVMLAELSLGRGAQAGPVSSLIHYGGEAWRWLGVLFVSAGFLILSYYGVIGGWTLRYAFEAALIGFPENPGVAFRGPRVRLR